MNGTSIAYIDKSGQNLWLHGCFEKCVVEESHIIIWMTVRVQQSSHKMNMWHSDLIGLKKLIQMLMNICQMYQESRDHIHPEISCFLLNEIPE